MQIYFTDIYLQWRPLFGAAAVQFIWRIQFDNVNRFQDPAIAYFSQARVWIELNWKSYNIHFQNKCTIILWMHKGICIEKNYLQLHQINIYFKKHFYKLLLKKENLFPDYNSCLKNLNCIFSVLDQQVTNSFPTAQKWNRESGQPCTIQTRI